MAEESKLLGVLLGLGGFVDGIGFHQLAQWHSMGSAILPPTTMETMKQNMAWDGWFHAGHHRDRGLPAVASGA